MAAIIGILASFSPKDWFAAGSAVIAVVSFGLNLRTVRRQRAMQTEAFRRSRDDALIRWANDAIAAIADAQRHCRDAKRGLLSDAEQRTGQSELRTRLSVLLDTGRLFFPNQPPTTSGEETDSPPPSEIAYTGQPHDAITALNRVYRIMSDLGRLEGVPAADAVMPIVEARRRFVSEVFRTIDPRRRDAAFAALAG